MMKNAIIIHGKPDKEEYYSDEFPAASNAHWLPWLQKQLLMKDIYAVTPEMPLAYDPVYEDWRLELERYNITEETILIGHSRGAGFLVRWLSEHPTQKVGKVFLVAPFLDPEKNLDNDFFQFKIDPDLTERVTSLTIMISSDDDESMLASVAEIISEIPDTKLIEFTDRGHFIGDDYVKNGFPELLEEILK